MPRNWAPSSPIRMHHAYWREYIAISMRNGHALSCTPQSLLLLYVSYPNLFPRHIGLTRNNSKCFFTGPVFLLRTVGKGTKLIGISYVLGRKNENIMIFDIPTTVFIAYSTFFNMGNIWLIQLLSVPLQSIKL